MNWPEGICYLLGGIILLFVVVGWMVDAYWEFRIRKLPLQCQQFVHLMRLYEKSPAGAVADYHLECLTRMWVCNLRLDDRVKLRALYKYRDLDIEMGDA